MNDDIGYWISFSKINGLGPVKLYSIFKYFNNIKDAWNAEPEEFLNIDNINQNNVEQIREAKLNINPIKEAELLNKENIKAITLVDEDYPFMLKQMHDPPFVLYYKGIFDKNRLNKCIGMVGTRKPSYSGKKTAYKISFELAQNNITVVSGLALGVDTESHKGALKADNGYTIAVLGSGVDHIYPSSNKNLYYEIMEKGMLISEYPPETLPDSWRFPARNRIISGLSKGVVIVEAAEKSGALITADFALEQGKEVFAIPGDINNPMSKGPNNLIKQGASIVTDVNDIISNFNWKNNQKNIDKKDNPDILSLTDSEKIIYMSMDDNPQHIDILIDKIQLPLSEISSNLIMLEIKQLIKQLPGKLFVKV
ncbi:MAG: DNA-processing protein DprA [Candidatus Sericytochromatia bacterium]